LAALVVPRPSLAQQDNAKLAQGTATISGNVTITTVTGATDNLSGIFVKLTGPAPSTDSQTDVTDSEGSFSFPRLMPGSYKLGATLEGFKPWSS